MKTAVIFAAGLGQRFKNVNDYVHKSLMKYDGLTVIQHIIENLISAKNVGKIIVITGYQANKFDFLSKQYQQVTLRYNQWYKQFNSAYALNLIIDELEANEDMFLITGDFVMRQNCFLAKITGNLMAATAKTSEKNDWCYQLNQNNEIIGLQKSTDSQHLLASEWSHLSAAWAKSIAQDLQNQHVQQQLETEIVGKYLINTSLKYHIKVKPYLLDSANFWDLDTEADWKRLDNHHN